MRTPGTILVYALDPRFSGLIGKRLTERGVDLPVIVSGDILETRKTLEAGGVSALIAEIDPDHPEEEQFLASLMVDHSATPCIVIAAESHDFIREKAFAMGALAFFPKSADIAHLAERVTAFVNPGSEGGKLFSISPFAILQVIQMEQRSCTLKAQSTKTKRSGAMYFSEGALLEAKFGAKTGPDAALEMLQWEEVDIQIHNYCPVEVKRIYDSLESLLLQAEKLRDERKARSDAADTEVEYASAEFLLEDLDDELELDVDVYERLCGFLEDKRGVVDVGIDPSWDGIIDFARKASKLCDFGKLLTCHFSGSQLRRDLVIVPGQDTVAVSVEKNSAKDAMIDLVLSFGG